ncbi:MAG TPA: phosphate ABC transporter substrate-binding protein PstS [Gemmataceae bacterium]|nr:phosphate ABC transporter substrate-binding protein PstS [Gemmataceae bacterium]
MRRALAITLFATALAVAGCGGGKSAPTRVSGGGATFVDPLMQKWSGEYKTAKGVEIDYVAKGSGYGISNVTSKNIEFGCTDAPMNAKEVDAAKTAGGEVIHVPVTIGAVAIIYNLPGVSGLKLNGEVLADIYLKKLTTWNDPRIAALNPGVNLPGAPIGPVRRKESSGTTNIFTEYLSKRSAEFATSPGTSKDPKWPEGVEGKPENAGIAEHVKNTPNAIGYVELAFARKNGIPFATLVNNAGKAVAPDAASVTAAVDSAMKVKQEKEPYSLHPLSFSFTDADGDAAYPIVGASYAILFKKQAKDKGPAIVAFLMWAVTDGQKFAADLQYAPLPAKVVSKIEDRLKSLRSGDKKFLSGA